MADAQQQDRLKRQVADAAIETLSPWLEADSIIGVGTGSTTNHFIDALAGHRGRFAAAVSSSTRSTERLAAHGIRVVDLAEVDSLVVYVDGADEVEPGRALIKGGGGAHTREKIVAAAADRFVCIVDATKMVDTLGAFPLPVEVIPMAWRSVSRRLRVFGGDPQLRDGVTTDNCNAILDVHGLAIRNPDDLEWRINNIAGVVENGIFAANRPQMVLVGTAGGVRLLE